MTYRHSLSILIVSSASNPRHQHWENMSVFCSVTPQFSISLSCFNAPSRWWKLHRATCIHTYCPHAKSIKQSGLVHTGRPQHISKWKMHVLVSGCMQNEPRVYHMWYTIHYSWIELMCCATARSNVSRKHASLSSRSGIINSIGTKRRWTQGPKLTQLASLRRALGRVNRSVFENVLSGCKVFSAKCCSNYYFYCM